MSTLLSEIDAKPWHRMFHAYGVATNTPGHLKALAGSDADARSAAIEHLFSAEIHQGTPWPSTATTAVFVGRLLAEGLVADPTAQANLLNFLRVVAEAGDLGDGAAEARARAYPDDDSAINAWLDRYLATSDDESLWTDEMDTADLLMARAAVDCHDAMPLLLDPVLALTTSPEPRVRAAACGATAILTRHPDTAARRDELAAAWAEHARTTNDIDERAALVMALGEIDAAPHEFLTDPWLIVRGCAALAPALADDPAAHDVLADLIASPRAFDAGFTNTPPQFPMWPRYRLIQAACERIDDDQRLIAGIGGIAPAPGWFISGFEIEPYLSRFFAQGWPTLEQRTSGQRAMARLIAHADGLWKPTDGNRGVTLTRLGLPTDRDAWRHLADTPKQPGTYTADDIEVLTPAAAIRHRPAMYFGRPATDPRLPDTIVDHLAHAYNKAVAEETVTAFTLTVDSDLGFTLEVTGHQLPPQGDDADGFAILSALMTGQAVGPDPLLHVALAAAMCARATATLYTRSHARTRQFAHATALGPVIDIATGPTEHEDGYLLAFELDAASLADGAQLTKNAATGSRPE